MDTKKENALVNTHEQLETALETELQAETNENKKPKRIRKPATEAQLSNPLHGIKLKQLLERLVAYYGWEYLGDRTNINCFKYYPTMKSSLGFLRKTTWAREFVEDLYLDMVDEKKEKE